MSALSEIVARISHCSDAVYDAMMTRSHKVHAAF